MAGHIYLGSNLKMYKTARQTQDYLLNLSMSIGDLSRRDLTVFIIPSFTSLDRARRTIHKGDILLGAQNMHWEDEGQFTGEISPLMLEDLGVEVVEIGHSERRHVMGETDAAVNRKTLSALAHGFICLLCVGETAEQKALGLSDETLRTQLKTGLWGVPTDSLDRLWIAYEPVWAIGVGGTPASEDYADGKHAVIKHCLSEMYGSVAGRVPVLYGGSVNRGNCDALAAMPHIDGLFIGRAAWDANAFNEIIRAVLPVFQRKQGMVK
jgi:triosephosphate isomerase